MNQLIHKLIEYTERLRIGEKPFVIISDNCWGYELYKALKRGYNTPFVGLFLNPECYLTFLEKFDYYINTPLTFIEQSKYEMRDGKEYPVGLLGGIVEVHFLHYSSHQEALEKWTRRSKRMKLALDKGEPIFVKIDLSSNEYTPEILHRFHALPFKNKLSIGSSPYKSNYHINVPKRIVTKTRKLTQARRLYKKRCHYFDISYWIKNSVVRQSIISRLFALVS